jgi:hypothetical protein
VGPRTGLNVVEKKKFLTLPGLELRPLGRSVHSKSLYLLRYPGSPQRLPDLVKMKFKTVPKIVTIVNIKVGTWCSVVQ